MEFIYTQPATLSMYLRLKAKTIGGNHYYAIKNIDIIPSLQQRARFSRKGEASLKGGGRV